MHVENWNLEMSSMQFCSLCETAVPSTQAYVSHIRLTHSNDSNFLLVCGINGCDHSVKTASSFSSHVYRYHRAALNLPSQSSQLQNESNQLYAEPNESYFRDT